MDNSYPGLRYPTDKNYLTALKERGYFILVDRTSTNVSLLPGGSINEILSSHPDYMFVFDIHLAGCRQDIVDSLYLAGHGIDAITKIVSSGICSSNVMTSVSQDWIKRFSEMNAMACGKKSSGPVTDQPPPNISYPVTSKYSSDYIVHLRKSIHEEITEKYLEGVSNFESLPNILNPLFDMYDKIFFRNRLSEIIREKGLTIRCELSDKLTKVAGHCTEKDCVHTITLSRPIMLKTFRNGEKVHCSNGLQCHDRLECLMNVFEYELIHFVIEITHGHVKGDPILKSHGYLFQQLALAYFGHTHFKHALNHNIEVMGKREDFSVGDTVIYRAKDGSSVTGVISKLNPKRAIVGNMYVPYTILKKAAQNDIPDPVDDFIIYENYNSYKVNDIVAFSTRSETIVSRIIRINEKTFSVGDYRVSKHLVRHATDDEITKFLSSPKSLPEKTRKDFYVGQSVQFKDGKGTIINGVIEKLNPVRAVIGKYCVPYNMLTGI